jgi:hypothetical protein
LKYCRVGPKIEGERGNKDEEENSRRSQTKIPFSTRATMTWSRYRDESKDTAEHHFLLLELAASVIQR